MLIALQLSCYTNLSVLSHQTKGTKSQHIEKQKEKYQNVNYDFYNIIECTVKSDLLLTI
jgi:hypothetical protein